MATFMFEERVIIRFLHLHGMKPIRINQQLSETCNDGVMDWLWAGWSGDGIAVGARFSAPIQTRPGAHSASYIIGTGCFPGGKAARVWLWPPTPSSAEVKGRVELYIYSTSGPLWPVLGWTFTFSLWWIFSSFHVRSSLKFTYIFVQTVVIVGF